MGGERLIGVEIIGSLSLSVFSSTGVLTVRLALTTKRATGIGGGRAVMSFYQEWVRLRYFSVKIKKSTKERCRLIFLTTTLGCTNMLRIWIEIR